MTLTFEPLGDGHTNMARDLELLRRAEMGEPRARLYSWDGLWVSLGRFQTAEEALLKPVPYVIRPTGGRAVVHGHDITVALAAPRFQRARSVKQVYRDLVSPLLTALGKCGLDAHLAEDTPFSSQGVIGADCFAFSSPNDVVDARSGLKVCGCALRITNRAALLQVSIPYREPHLPIEEVIVGGTRTPVQSWNHDLFPTALCKALL